MQTIEQFELALKIVKEKLEWEYRRCSLPMGLDLKVTYGEWTKGFSHEIGVLNEVIANPRKELRIKKKEFPDLPPGYMWYNPYALSPDMIPEGYRLLTASEVNENKWDNVLFKRMGFPQWNEVENMQYKHDPYLGYTYITLITTPLMISVVPVPQYIPYKFV